MPTTALAVRCGRVPCADAVADVLAGQEMPFVRAETDRAAAVAALEGR